MRLIGTQSLQSLPGRSEQDKATGRNPSSIVPGDPFTLEQWFGELSSHWLCFCIPTLVRSCIDWHALCLY